MMEDKDVSNLPELLTPEQEIPLNRKQRRARDRFVKKMEKAKQQARKAFVLTDKERETLLTRILEKIEEKGEKENGKSED